MNTQNWRVREVNEDLFFIEGDLPDSTKEGNYPRVEVMQEDFGDHNGYTHEIRMNDAKLIVAAPHMKEAINKVLDTFVKLGNVSPNPDWIRKVLSECILKFDLRD